jgi:hypothetical protein
VANTTNCFYELTIGRRPITRAPYLIPVPRIEKVKGFHPGHYGYLDIGRRPLMLPIPKFSLQMEDHVTLASPSSDCHDIVEYYKFVKKVLIWSLNQRPLVRKFASRIR